MSIKRFLLAAAIVLFGLAVGGTLAHFRYQADLVRNPASALPAPNLRVLPYAHSLQGKNNRLLNITISPVSGLPDHDSQEITLQALITLLQPIDGDLEYHWILPDGVEHVSGELKDSWANVRPGQTAQTTISLLNFSKASVPSTVVLQVSGQGPTARVGGVMTFSTQDLVKMAEEASGLQKKMNVKKDNPLDKIQQ